MHLVCMAKVPKNLKEAIKLMRAKELRMINDFSKNQKSKEDAREELLRRKLKI